MSNFWEARRSDIEVMKDTVGMGRASEAAVEGKAAAIGDVEGERLAQKMSQAEAFDGRWTGYQVKQLAQRWERLGLLTRPRHATDARRVEEKLLRMAGVAAPPAAGSAGAQGSQAC